MPLVAIGVLLLAAWWADFGPFGKLPWWAVALPFVGAVLWWWFADSTGWTKKRAMNKMEERKVKRREAQMEALGLGIGKSRDKLQTKVRAGKARVASADPRRREEPPAPPPASATNSRKDPKL
jgi:small Trp-rich protein